TLFRSRAPRPRRDSVTIPLPARADTMLRNDSAAQGILGRGEQRTVDTLKAPLARAEAPPVLEIGAPRIYDRAAIFATGALTLSDLLGRVPGLTTLATGWYVAPTAVAFQGDLRGVRIFLDGIELDPMDQREQGRSPVNDLPLHTLEELRIERGADEVRVYARSWRVSSTTPYTRADVLTGDQNTNIFRGYFGRRYSRGGALQVSAEQGSTQPLSRLPSSDTRSFLLRFGMASGAWSADAVAQRTDVNRGVWMGQGGFSETLDSIAPMDTRRTTAYLRLANGDPDAARWAQVIASSHGFSGNPATSSADTLVRRDTTTYENQFLFTGGMRRGPGRVSVTERVRVAAGRTSAVPSVRASLETDPLAVSLFGEGRSPFTPARAEATGRIQLLRHVALVGSAARSRGGVFERVVTPGAPTPVFRANGTFSDLPLGPELFDSTTSTAYRYELAGRTSLRAEAALRVRDLWVGGGLLHRGATTLLPAAGLGSGSGQAEAMRTEGSATATTASLRGRLWRAVNVDAWAVAWGDTAGLYRPRYQTRAELYLQTNLLERFPKGNFGLLTSVAHEYRSNTRFASGDTVRTAIGSRTLDFKLEIRVQSAVVSYQFRNLVQQRYAQVPGFTLPRQTQFYGVRWDFFN
ncbi:MAG: TonB-dependent receptor plug, partial [Gemmatimonadetes bacterium]|nr:TonB-dependent receptor plug [Gemmatimonadota bacterium]